ncbi:MAG: HD domain-containing protein [Spirochaetales bacterium]|nr:HD domain-containing protein [Spirochaetales bacterium]
MDRAIQAAPEGAAASSLLEASFSALDRYLGLVPGPIRFGAFRGDLGKLARAFDGVGYPSLSWADASLPWGSFGPRPPARRRPPWLPSRFPPPADPPEAEAPVEGISELLVACEDDGETAGHAYAALDLLYDRARRVYVDRRGAREAILSRRLEPRSVDASRLLFETAALLARGGWDSSADLVECPLPRDVAEGEQRRLLVVVACGKDPARGFDWLLRVGFVRRYWPELAELVAVEHAKELHPEGDGWRHTMETFAHRKAPDLTLSLGLLLHDLGKTRASAESGRRFDRHAEIGAELARRFLLRLGFPAALAADVDFLVRRHMMPAAFPRLPLFRTQETLEHPLAPLLLELYRCDELSSFRGPDGYYEACAAYRAFLKNARNPWRSADGRKSALRWLEEATPTGRGGRG